MTLTSLHPSVQSSWLRSAHAARVRLAQCSWRSTLSAACADSPAAGPRCINIQPGQLNAKPTMGLLAADITAVPLIIARHERSTDPRDMRASQQSAGQLRLTCQHHSLRDVGQLASRRPHRLRTSHRPSLPRSAPRPVAGVTGRPRRRDLQNLLAVPDRTGQLQPGRPAMPGRPAIIQQLRASSPISSPLASWPQHCRVSRRGTQPPGTGVRQRRGPGIIPCRGSSHCGILTVPDGPS